MSHIQITIAENNQDIQDIIIAELAAIGYEGFEQENDCIKAFISQNLFDRETLETSLQDYQLSYTQNIIEQQNWNKVWESNFDPVIVDNFVSIRASFHQPIKDVEHEIVITPKMSFGTGHHATTYMMMQLMREIDFKNKSVFDFGTGTGILAILAEKLGAKNILAVDYDDWCIENAKENVEQNNCLQITIEKSDNANTHNQYDIVIANINKNIIQDNFIFIDKATKAEGIIFLSGLLAEDEADIQKLAASNQWKHIKTINKGAWIAILFRCK